MRWKHTDARWRDRALSGISAVPDERIREVTADIDRIDNAAELHCRVQGFAFGVGVASISAILAAGRPDRFPVIDVFALMALIKHEAEPWHGLIRFDRKTRRPTVSDRVYPPFVDTCRRLAQVLQKKTRRTEWTPRRVDMALWGIGKQLQATF